MLINARTATIAACVDKIYGTSLLAEVSHDEATRRERRETLSFLSFLRRRERPLLAGNYGTFLQLIMLVKLSVNIVIG